MLLLQRLKGEGKGFSFPYVIDKTQEVAKAYGAVCTPDFFGFDKDLTLKFRGRLDSSGMNDDPTATRELFAAMQEIASTGEVSGKQNPSMGFTYGQWLQMNITSNPFSPLAFSKL